MGIVCKLEDDLIPPNNWQTLYPTMPKECQQVVTGPRESLGIGKNETLGWFIMGCGQGPCLLWYQKCTCTKVDRQELCIHCRELKVTEQLKSTRISISKKE